MQPQPLVTVIIPAYNAAATVARAVASALAQTYRPIEVIVVDDCSKDATSEIVAAYRDERIQLLHLPYNQGVSGAMNEGLSSARGEYIAFLDADDEWLPTKLAKQVPVLRENPRATMVYCACYAVDRSGKVGLDWGTPPSGLGKGGLWRSLLSATHIAKSCVVARTSALREVGPFDITLRIAEDQDMWIRLARAGEVEFAPGLLTVLHDTPGSLTKVYAAQVDQHVLPMVRRQIERHRKDLSNGEIRHILAVRYTSVGRALYRNGLVIRGAVLLVKAILLHHQIGENLWYLIVASPPALAVKRLLRGSNRKTLLYRVR